MTDSPAVHVPIDPNERPILERLLILRDDLSLMRQDRSTYIKSQDIEPLYDQLVQQVSLLNNVRKEEDKPLEQNRLDYVLDDCFQLVSLFFMTVGRIDEAPASYAESSTLKRLLDHLKEAALYSSKDLAGLHRRINIIQSNIENGKGVHSPHLLTLLERRLALCKKTLGELEDLLSTLNPTILPIYEKLVAMLRALSACNTRTVFPQSEVEELREELNNLDSQMVNDKFVGPDGEIPPNQDFAVGLLRRCQVWGSLVMSKKGQIDGRFEGTYKKLKGIRDKLEKLTITQAWSLRETDLYHFQRELDRVDESRIEHNFIDVDGQPADLHAQRTLLYLLRKSYSLIYLLILSSEPVSEALLPIYNQLQTTRRCLLEVQQGGGVSSPRELYPYSMKLNSIDNMRVDGKFMVGNDIPEGQAKVNALLAECYEIAYLLRTEAESDSD